MELTGSRTVTLLAQLNFTTLLCLIRVRPNFKFWEKNPSRSFNDYKRMT